jgi:hypothetical protein
LDICIPLSGVCARSDYGSLRREFIWQNETG